jgi:hypothetical protein
MDLEEQIMDNKIKIDSLYRDIEELTKKALRDIERLDDNLPVKEMKKIQNRIGLNLMFIEDLRMELIKTIEEDPSVQVAWVLNFEQMVEHLKLEEITTKIINNKNKGE